MRLAVYTDYVYKRRGSAVYAQRAFALFLARLGGEVDALAITGRLDPEPGESYYRLPDDVEFVPLPHYASLARPLSAAPAMLRSLGLFWRLLGRVDAVWLLGPYPLSFVFVLLAALRRRRVFLGVRQDWPTYVRSRHPASRVLHAVAWLMEVAWRALGRMYPVVVVGPELARNYSRARAVLPVTVAMVEEEDIAPPREADGMALWDLVRSQPGWGEARSARFFSYAQRLLRHSQIRREATIGSLTERDRAALLRLLVATTGAGGRPRLSDVLQTLTDGEGLPAAPCASFRSPRDLSGGSKS